MEDEDCTKGAVRFDKFIVALTSLDLLLHCLKTVKDKETYWQWIYISLHNAVQAYMVLALTGTHSLLTYRRKHMVLWMNSYDNREELPEVELDNFLNLYERTKTIDLVSRPNAIPFVPSGTQEESINNLKEWRNNFVHFLSDSLLHFLGDAPFQLVADCLDYIEFLAFQSTPIISFNDHYKTETERLLSECRSVIALSCSPR